MNAGPTPTPDHPHHPDTPPPEDRIIDRLGQEERILKQARRLPVGKLKDEQIADIRERVQRYCNSHGVFNAQLARETDLSPSVVSQFFSGNYKGDNEKVARVLNDWTERHGRQQRREMPGDYVTMQVTEDIRTIVGVACASSQMAAIVAPSGCGKTLVLQVLADRLRGRYLYCHEDLKTGPFLRSLAGVIGCPTTGTKARHGRSGRLTNAEQIDAIVRELEGTNRPIILDEAHRLPREIISRIRTIHDQAKVPIILAGAAEILDNINDRADGRGQFASRCLTYNVINHVTNAEDPTGGGGRAGRPLYTKDEIARFLTNLEVRLDKDGLELAWAVACLPNHGCLRTLRSLVMMVRPDRESRDEPIRRDELKAAMTMLFDITGALVVRLAEHHINITRKAGAA